MNVLLFRFHKESLKIVNNIKQKQSVLPTISSNLPWSIRRIHHLPNFYTQANDTKPYRDSVIVYLHHNKAAGTTTKKCLSSIASSKKRKMGTLLSSQGRMVIERSKASPPQRFRSAQIFMGGYAFGICNQVTQKYCSYFTILRDPYERLISSYSYCKRARTDQICSALGANDVSITEWAQHQGSFLFQQLVFDPLFCTTHFLHNKNLSSLEGIPHSIIGANRIHSAPCWFRQKVVMHHVLNDSQSEALLNYCLENLENWFSMIGLVEEYDTSLTLLEDVYKLPFKKCATRKAKNKSNYLNLNVPNETETNVIPANETLKQLKLQLQRDPVVTKALAADIQLYERGKEIFEKQKMIYNERLSQ